MDMKRCDCKRCQQYAKYDHILKFLQNNGERYVDEFTELYSDLVHTSIDLNHIQAIVDGSWPSAQDYMRSHGWVKDTKSPTEGFEYWIGSFGRKGEKFYECMAKLHGQTIFGFTYVGEDGKLYEVRDQKQVYPYDYARKIRNEER